jgi:hypothetical protein
MSKITVDAVDKQSGSTLTLGGAGTTVNVSNMVPDVSLSNRNLIINGAMNVAQRGTQAGQGASNSYTAVDRYEIVVSGAKTALVTSSKQSTTTGEFSNQIKLDCTTAQASVASGDLFAIRQKIEGQNLQHLQYGTLSAKTLTASFTITSPKSGIHCVQLHNRDVSYSYVREFTVDAANTAQRISVTFPGYTATALDNDNNSSLELAWALIAGSDWQTTKDGWTSGNDFATSNQQNLLDSTANNFLITGIQLEVGSVATPFEHESYGDTLAKCQRYYEKSYNDGVAPATSTFEGVYTNGGMVNMPTANYTTRAGAVYKVTKRAVPTVVTYDTAGNTGKCNYPDTTTNKTFTVVHIGENSFTAETSNLVNGTDTRCYFHFTADSEL